MEMDEDYYGPRFTYGGNSVYPIIFLDEGQTEDQLVYDLEEAEVLLKTLTEAVEALRESNTDYVQVVFASGYAASSTSRRYTYTDPSGAVKVGDWVEVRSGNSTQIVKVVALGRGSWTGPVKPIIAKLERKEL